MNDEIGKELGNAILTKLDNMDVEIKSLKTNLNEFKEQTEKRFITLENELMRNSEQHTAINQELAEIKAEQKEAQKRDAKILSEIRARDSIMMDALVKIGENRNDINDIKAKLAM